MAKTGFEDRNFFIIRSLVEYGRYGKSKVKAGKILHSYFPDYTLLECLISIEKYLSVYLEIQNLIHSSQEYFFDKYENHINRRDLKGFNDEHDIFKKYPEIPEAVLEFWIYWIYDWHLRR